MSGFSILQIDVDVEEPETSENPTRSFEIQHSYDFVDQRTSNSGGGNSAAAQLLEYRRAAGLPDFGGSPEEETWRRKGLYSRS
ncbi:unnamed protein product [Boreogadus saida]